MMCVFNTHLVESVEQQHRLQMQMAGILPARSPADVTVYWQRRED